MGVWPHIDAVTGLKRGWAGMVEEDPWAYHASIWKWQCAPY